MRIAVIGWGSLIWCPGSLAMATKWHRDGPKLPVEYARVSLDKRLTLVLVNMDVEVQPTLWVESAFTDIADARKNLQTREGACFDHMGAWCMGATPSGLVESHIASWCESKMIDGAVWTALPPKLSPKDVKKNKRVMTVDEAVNYLRGLKGPEARKAEEYVRNTPSQINTKIRVGVRSELGWDDNELSETLFEPS
jgi:hypothetical protein